MSYQKLKNCPVCTSNKIEVVSSYGPCSFFQFDSLCRCGNCEVLFVQNLPSDELVNEYYSSGSFYNGTTEPFSTSFIDFSYKLARSRVFLIKKIIKKTEINSVLDIGAGNAEFGNAIRKDYPELEYDVVEPDNVVRQQYGTRVGSSFSNINEIEQKKYDLLVLNQVLEHTRDPVAFLKNIEQLGASGSFIHIDVPYHDFLFKPSVEPHLFFWNKMSLTLALEKAKFKIMFCDTCGMKMKSAKRFFSEGSLTKYRDPWYYLGIINRIVKGLGLPKPFDLFNRFHAYDYGGERQWLRCIARKQ